MADKEWLRNLAQATWKDGRWQHAEPEKVKLLLRKRIEDAVYQILLEAQDAAEVFNQYTKAGQKLTVLPIYEQGDRLNGVTMMLGSAQAAVRPDGQALDFTLSVMQGFQRLAVRSYKILPQVDAFGSLIWQTGNSPMMTYDLLVKNILEDLTRHAQASGASS
jgi:hypothetical protein